jgi:hypothetical protein
MPFFTERTAHRKIGIVENGLRKYPTTGIYPPADWKSAAMVLKNATIRRDLIFAPSVVGCLNFQIGSVSGAQHIG